MKGMIRGIQAVFFMFILLSGAYGQGEIFFYEGFESGSKPSGWTEQKVPSGIDNKYWRYQDGGHSQAPNPYKRPPSAYAGNYNAIYQVDINGYIARLITPTIDLRFAIKPVLSFWHAQDEWGTGNNDELKVYYRPDNLTDWVLLEHYPNVVPNWTKREIQLPDEAKTQTLQIRFEGISKWGWGVCIDELEITETGILPRAVDFFSFTQLNRGLPTGSHIHPLAFLKAVVSGNSGNLSVNSVTFLFTGDNISDLENFRLFHTRDTVFSPFNPLNLQSNEVSANLSINGNEITLTAPEFNLLTGENYLWLCADVHTSANDDNYIRFSLEANSVNLGGTTFPASTQTPTGQSVIEHSLLVTNFQSSSGWTLNGDWEIGEPTGIGDKDPSLAFSGLNVLATNLSGVYTRDIPVGSPHMAITDPVSARYYKDVKVRYRRWLNIDALDRARVKLSSDGGIVWSTIMEHTNNIFDNYWRNLSHDVGHLATRKENIRLQFSIDNTNSNTEYGGWNIDNLAITGEFISRDVGVVNFTSPQSVCGMTSAETVKVIVKNFGGATVSTPFEVGYSLDGGTAFTKEFFTQEIASEEELEFTFSTPADFSTPGLKNLVFKTFLQNDQDTQNDSYSSSFYVFSEVSFPYVTSFETSNGSWHPSGRNSTWQWGIPDGTTVKTASNGTKLWATSLKFNYLDNDSSFLSSPCLNLGTAEFPVITFDFNSITELAKDGFNLQYSIDGGLTWALVTAHPDYSANWFNADILEALDQPGWSGNSSGYITAKTLLPEDALVAGTVKFRFAFASGPSNQLEGIYIDHIRIQEMPDDVGLVELLSPQDACEIGNDVTLDMVLENFARRTLKENTKVPIRIQVNQGSPVQDTILVTKDMAQNDTLKFTTNRKFNLFSTGFYDIRSWTVMADDEDRSNDTLTAQVEVYGIPGYTLGPDIGTMQPDTVIIDAGADFFSYLWQDNSTNRFFNVPLEGIYSVTVQNDRGCTAFDEIEIIPSDKDVAVIAQLNLSDECVRLLQVSPQVSIENIGNTFLSGEVIPVAVMVNGSEVLVEDITLTGDFLAGNTLNHTFTGGIDLSEPGTYQLSLYTKLGMDLNKNNDSIHLEISTFGLPVVDFLRDTIPSLQADTIKLQLDPGYATYQWWERADAGEWTGLLVPDDTLFQVSRLTSYWYKAEVTDIHGCGIANDSVYINAKDLSLTRIVNPADTICFSETAEALIIRIKNTGRDIYMSGTDIEASASTPVGPQNTVFTLSSNLIPGDSLDLSFPASLNLPVGSNYLTAGIIAPGDVKASNDLGEAFVEVSPSPVVNIEPDTLFKIFQGDLYKIEPSYSIDVSNYLWQDNSTNQDYTIYFAPSYDYYRVIGSNAWGCSASDSILVISHDLLLSAIKSPTNACELEDDTPITLTLRNNGNKTFFSGTQFLVKVKLNGTPSFDETITLNANLNPASSTDRTLTQKLILNGFSSAQIEVEIEWLDGLEVFYDNNSLNKTVYSTGFPVVSLGVDREIHAWEELLQPGTQFDSYLWQDGSTEDEFLATETGLYSVTVTDFAGCSSQVEVNLTFFVDDISIISMDEPVSACDMGNAEVVKVTLKNTGTWILPMGHSIDIGFSGIGAPASETYVLTESLSPDQTIQVQLTNTMDFSTRTTYNITVWVDMNNDMVPENNSISTQVQAYPDVAFSFPTDTIFTTGTYELDPGEFHSYLWYNGATTRTIMVSESGLVWVEVYNSNGCFARDSVIIQYTNPDLSITSIMLPQNACSLSDEEEVRIRLRNTGEYNFPVDTQIELTLRLEGSIVSTTTITLTEPLNINQNLDVSFPDKLDMSAVGSYLLQASLFLDIDAIPANNAQEVTRHHRGNPVVDLGADRWSNSGPVLLDAGTGGANYQWQDGSTEQTFLVTETGNYSVTVISPFACSTYAEVHIAILHPDYALTAILSPETSCSLGESEQVRVELSNLGTDTLQVGHELPLVLRLEGSQVAGETFTLTNTLRPGETTEYQFIHSIDLSSQGSYFIEAEVNHSLDVDESNNKLQKNIEVYGSPTVVLAGGVDTLFASLPVTLDAGPGFASYLWQNGSAQQSMTATEFGRYWVRVTDANNCPASDTVVVQSPVSAGKPILTGKELRVFPNPVRDVLHVVIETERQIGLVRLELFNLQSIALFRKEIFSTHRLDEEIPVAHLPKGVYILRITVDGSTQNQRILIL